MARVPVDDPAVTLAVDFLNTYDALETPPDRLSVARVRDLAARHGLAAWAGEIRDADLERLRDLRERLRPAFAATDRDAKVAALDDVLAGGRPRLVPAPDGGLRLAARGTGDAVDRFGVALADAIAYALTVGGPDRFGACAADPCHCVYVDRTRAGRQRYCCELCNDRMAAAAYRRRRS